VRYLMGTAYLPDNLAKWAYSFFVKLLSLPPRLILVEVDPSIALRRIMSRTEKREMFESLSKLQAVQERMLELGKADWAIVDNSGPEASTRSEVRSLLERWDASLGR